jgi:hypothetical protein
MPAERADLISYLDRELPKPEARVIVSYQQTADGRQPSRRALLSAGMIDCATARREVEALEKTWDLFDFQPRPKASENLGELHGAGPHRGQPARRSGGRFESVVVAVRAPAARRGGESVDDLLPAIPLKERSLLSIEQFCSLRRTG